VRWELFVVRPLKGLAGEIGGPPGGLEKNVYFFRRDSGNLRRFAFLSLCFAVRRSIDCRQSYSDSLAGVLLGGAAQGAFRYRATGP